MLYEIVNIFPHQLFSMNVQPCISLYQPTHRQSNETQQDMIRFKNLTKKIEQSLSEKYDKNQIESLMKPFKTIASDKNFWQRSTDGLAIFATEGVCIIYRLQRKVKELAIVASSFHIKPLIRNFQSRDRYHLLGLNRKQFTLFEGNRYGVEKITLDPSIPSTISEILQDEDSEKYISAGSHRGPRGTGMLHGSSTKQDIIDRDMERFFRHVDRTVLEHYSKPTEFPLYLVALSEYHTPFQHLSRNPFLQKAGLKIDYTSLSINELKEMAWEMIEPQYLEKTRQLVDEFKEAQAKFQGSDDIAQVARAASENQIHKILIEADRLYPGRVNTETGELISGDLTDPEIDDVLDDLAEMVFSNKGEVVVLPKERMPSNTGVAAIYRY